MVAMATISIGCMARLAPAAEGPPAFESGYASAIVQPEGISLFKGDSAVLTDADIARILSFRTALRSEEHTSELQSRVDLVCRLLLETKQHTHQPQYPK